MHTPTVHVESVYDGAYSPAAISWYAFPSLFIMTRDIITREDSPSLKQNFNDVIILPNNETQVVPPVLSSFLILPLKPTAFYAGDASPTSSHVPCSPGKRGPIPPPPTLPLSLLQVVSRAKEHPFHPHLYELTARSTLSRFQSCLLVQRSVRTARVFGWLYSGLWGFGCGLWLMVYGFTHVCACLDRERWCVFGWGFGGGRGEVAL